MCVGGSPVDSDSVCIEHGETDLVFTAYSERVAEAPGPSADELCHRLLAAQALRHVAADS